MLKDELIRPGLWQQFFLGLSYHKWEVWSERGKNKCRVPTASRSERLTISEEIQVRQTKRNQFTSMRRLAPCG